MKNQGNQTKDKAVEAAQAIAEALPVLPGAWKRSRISAFGVKTILVLLAALIGMPNPRVLACACTEVVGGSGAVSSNLSVSDSDGSLALVQSDIKLPGLVPIQLTRTYESESNLFGMFGPGWMVDIVSFLKTTTGDIEVHFNGNVEKFASGNGYVNNKKNMKLSFTGPSEVTVLESNSGAQWVFSLDDSTLKKYIDRNGNQVNYTWKKVQKTVAYAIQGDVIVWSGTQDIYCPLTVTYPDGRQLTFSYDATGDYQYLCRQVTGAAENTISYTYTNDGLLTGVSMGGGQVLNYTYNKITDNVKTLGRLTKIAYANAAEVAIGYNGGNRVASVTGPHGYNHTYGYEGADPDLTTTLTDSLNHSKSFTYTNGLKNKLITDALGHTTYIDNNAQFRPESVINSKGKSTMFTYDSGNADALSQNNLLSQTNALGKTWNFTWDSNFNRTKSADPLGHEVNFMYDGNRNLLTVANGLNQTVRTNTYTPQGLLATTTDGRNKTTGFAYDTNGFLTKLTDAAGKEWGMTYDGSGNLLTSTNPLGYTTIRTYNSFKKVATATDVLANITSFTYDEMANLTSVTDANNNVTSYLWDQFQRVTSITNALNNTTTYTYDAEANLTTLTDSLNHAYSYTLDAVNNTKTFKFPDNRQESYDYDANNNLTTRTDCAGQQITYTYDDADRLTTKTYGDDTVFTNSYDDANRLTGITRVKSGTTESSIAYTLNAADQVISLVTDGCAIVYGYDSGQNVNQITYPSGMLVRYDYDDCNGLSSIKETLI